MDCTGPWRGAVERREWRLWVGGAQPGPEWGRYVGLVRNHKSGGRGGGHSRSSLKAWIRSKCHRSHLSQIVAWHAAVHVWLLLKA